MSLIGPGAPRSDEEAASNWDVPLGTPPAASRYGITGASGSPGFGSTGTQPVWHTRRFGVIACAVAALMGVSLLAVALVLRGGGGSSGDVTVQFLALGDWGRQGGSNQSAVAELMGRVGAARRTDFIVSTGDNFYDGGLASAGDALFQQSFVGVYAAPALQRVPWHAVLGNHDYCDTVVGCDSAAGCRESPLHQLNVTALNGRDPAGRWHCERSYTLTLAEGSVQIFFVDTSPFIERYQTAPWAHCAGGVLQQSWQEQLAELEGHLAASTASWKLVVGHHPPRSNGEHGNNTELMLHLEPLLLQYGVQAYFSGHDHNLEHLQPSGISSSSGGTYHIVVTGAGSKTDREAVGTTDSRFYYPYSGFVGVSVGGQRMTVDFFTLEGGTTPAYSATIALHTPSTKG